MNEELESAGTSELTRQMEAVRRLLREENYDAAITLTRELIEDHPDCGELYGALGDAYAARRMWPEAVEWYHEAVEHGDNSAQEKLSEAREQLGAQVRHRDEPSASELEQQRTRLWIVLASAGAVIVIAAVVASLTWLTTPSSPPPLADQPVRETSARMGRSAEYAPGRDALYGPGHMPPAPPGAAGVSAIPTSPGSGAPGEGPSVPTIVVGPGPHRPEDTSTSETVLVGPRSDRDIVLENAIGSLEWPDGTAMRNAVSVAMDPHLGYAMVTFEIPRGLQTRNLYATVVRQSYSIAAAAMSTDPGLNFVTLRGLIDLTGSERGGRSVVAFRGNTSRESIQGWLARNRTPTQQQLWSQVFATTWWNPGVPRTGLK